MVRVSKLILRFIVLAGILVLANVVAQASPKYACAAAPEGLTDGQLYTFDGEKMKALESANSLQGDVRIRKTLYFVVNTGGAERAGAIVIKTARMGVALPRDKPYYGRVQLKRHAASSSCSSGSSFFGSVSTEAYEAYHDLGHDHGDLLQSSNDGVAPLAALKGFHTSYEMTDYTSAKVRCRNTDDKKDADGVYEARSNRSQFSFSTGIVDHGIEGVFYREVVKRPVTWVASQIFTPVYAAEADLRERRVEIKTYQTEGGIACIPIRISARGKTQILRVNDLDRRQLFAHDFGRVKEFRLEGR